MEVMRKRDLTSTQEYSLKLGGCKLISYHVGCEEWVYILHPAVSRGGQRGA